MPVLLEPNATFDVCLKSDEQKPAESRPTFIARSQSMRNQRQVLHQIDAMLDEKNGKSLDDRFEMALDILMQVLVGWRNMGDWTFSRESLQDLLTFSEANELAKKIAANHSVQPEEKKS